MALGIGIVGAGIVGLKRASLLRAYPDVRIAGVADIERTARDAFAEKFETTLSVSNHHRLTMDADIDVIYICTPPATHHGIAMDSLKAGKHVILEQPIALSIEDGEEMVAAAESYGLQLSVALPRRYDPSVQEAARILETKEIGYPFLTILTHIEDDFDRLNDWHDWMGTWEMGGGGVLMRRGSEIFDLLRYIFGNIGAVNAATSRFAIVPLNKAEDSCLLALEFMEDVTAEVTLSDAARYSTWPEDYQGNAFRMEIYGREGSIRITNDEPRLTVVSNKNGRRTIQTADIETALPTDMDRDFLDGIINGTEPLVTADDSLEALRAILAGYKSSQMKRRVETLEQF